MNKEVFYHVLKLKDPHSNGPADLLLYLQKLITDKATTDLNLMGCFYGAFGLATNEAIWVTFTSRSDIEPSALFSDTHFQVLESNRLVPTVRPLEHKACVKEGFYVFRWFKVFNKDVQEIALLSKQAWETFETDFDSEIQGLFAEADHLVENGVEKGSMLLLTWYKNLSVWESSRKPSAEAKDNFTRRHALTMEAMPIATRLYDGSQEWILPSRKR